MIRDTRRDIAKKCPKFPGLIHYSIISHDQIGLIGADYFHRQQITRDLVGERHFLKMYQVLKSKIT